MRIRSRLSLRLRLESGVGEQSSITVMSFTRLGGGRGVYRRSSTSSHSHWKLFFIPDRSRTRGRTAELLPPRLVPTTNVWYTTPTVFHLPVINGYGILFLRAYIWPHLLLRFCLQVEPEPEPPYAPPSPYTRCKPSRPKGQCLP